MKILFLVPYPLNESPSQRFRFEQYFSLLTEEGHFYHVQSFLNSANWRLFFKPGNVLGRITALFKGFTKRFLMLFQVVNYDIVFIHREAAPLGPPIIEWVIAKIFRKKMIYDFDDAIWLTDRPNESWWFQLLKSRSKVRKICRWSHRISCGNNYLAEYARHFNERVIYNPTTIETDFLHVPETPNEKNKAFVNIGWTGSHSTLKYLNYLEPVFQQIEQAFPQVRFVIIADSPANLNLKSIHFVPWSLRTEIQELYKIDIGVMPLPDDEWSKGKCGFKALQYMSLQLPVIASPVGVNPQIIDHGIDGFLATTKEEWISQLTQLIENSELRISLGLNARKKVIQSYSVKSNAKNFLSLFNP